MTPSAGVRTCTVGALLAGLIVGPLVPSAVAATVAPRSVAPATSDDGVLGDEAGPAAATVRAPARADVRASAARAAAPAPHAMLPSAVDAQPVYAGQTSCDPFVKPGAKAFGDLMLQTYGTGAYGVARLCHQDATSEHKEGRAVDWMLSASDPAQRAVADSATAWLTADGGINARRLGVMYIIWNRSMWRAYAPERGWQPYSGANPHTDHIHVSLTWDGAWKRTSWWSGEASTARDRGPCRVYRGQYAPLYTTSRPAACPGGLPEPPASSRPVLVYGQRSSHVAEAQAALGVTADGYFGTATRGALLRWQVNAGVPRTGVLDNATWARMAGEPPRPETVKTPTVASPPVTTRSVDISPPTTPSVRSPKTVVTALTPYKARRLSSGSRGPAVAAVQKALGVTGESRMRTRTVAAVRALQRAYRLPVTGVTDIKTWNRIEERAYPLIVFRKTVLTKGTRGPAVVALQQALGVTGEVRFRTRTARAVRAVQAGYGLKADGVVNAATWLAVIHATCR